MRYNLGQTVELNFAVTPDETPTLTVTAPDGTVSTPTTTGSAGAYTALVDAAQAGRWTYVWSTPNGGDQVGTFEVGRAVVPLADVKTHLNITSATHDDELLGMLAAAAEVVGSIILPEFLPVDVAGRPALRLALLEFVRDIWTGTQTGGAFTGAAPAVDAPVLTAGRPALPPYVRGLLAPYLPGASRAGQGGPLGSFRLATPWSFG